MTKRAFLIIPGSANPAAGYRGKHAAS